MISIQVLSMPKDIDWATIWGTGISTLAASLFGVWYANYLSGEIEKNKEARSRKSAFSKIFFRLFAQYQYIKNLEINFNLDSKNLADNWFPNDYHRTKEPTLKLDINNDLSFLIEKNIPQLVVNIYNSQEAFETLVREAKSRELLWGEIYTNWSYSGSNIPATNQKQIYLGIERNYLNVLGKVKISFEELIEKYKQEVSQIYPDLIFPIVDKESPMKPLISPPPR